MAVMKATLSNSGSDFEVSSRSSVTGQRLPLAATIFAAASSSIQLQGDLGDGEFVKLQDIQAGQVTVLEKYSAEKYRITGTGTFTLNAAVQIRRI